MKNKLEDKEIYNFRLVEEDLEIEGRGLYISGFYGGNVVILRNPDTNELESRSFKDFNSKYIPDTGEIQISQTKIVHPHVILRNHLEKIAEDGGI